MFRYRKEEYSKYQSHYLSYTAKISQQVEKSVDWSLMNNQYIVSIQFGLNYRIFDKWTDLIVKSQIKLFVENFIDICELVTVYFTISNLKISFCGLYIVNPFIELCFSKFVMLSISLS